MVFQEIIRFWFKELTPKQWFSKDMRVDSLIREKFTESHRKATSGELFTFRETPEGRLAEIIIIDQFSRNIFRDDAKAFAFDTLALVLAQEAVRGGADQELPLEQRAFMYLPYMHSESPAMHEIAVRLFTVPGLENNLDFELRHKKIIDRFGRFPHRNKILGRESTSEEIEFLKTPGSSF